MAARKTQTRGFLALVAIALVAGAAWLLWPEDEQPPPAPVAATEPEPYAPTHAQRYVAPTPPTPAPEPRAVGNFALTATIRDEQTGHVVDDCAIRAAGETVPCTGGGSATVRSLPSGDISIRATATGYVPKDLIVSIGGRATTNVDISLVAGGKMGGTVFNPERKPLAGVFVRTSHYVMDSLRPAEVQARTDAEGHFTLDGVATGRVALRAESPEYATAVTKEFDVVAGAERTGIEVFMQAGGTVIGHVMTADGKPVASALVEAYSTVLHTGSASDHTTETDGSFRLEGLTEGIYTVVAKLNQQMGIWPNTIVGDNDETNITVVLGNDSVDGVVHDGSGAPVAGARVIGSSTFAANRVGASAVTDGEGTFHLDGLSGAPFEVKAEADKRGSAIANGVQPGAHIELTLAGQGRITGTVIGSGGHPADTFGVKLIPIGGASPASVAGRYRSEQFGSPDGTFHFDDVAVGSYRVVAQTSEGSGESEVQVSAGQSASATVTTTADERGERAEDSPPNANTQPEESDGGPSLSRPNVPPPNQDQHEEFGGIGAGLRNANDGNVAVTFVMEGGPAFLAGVQAGDEIVAVNGEPVTGDGLSGVIQMIRGPAGTPVDLSILRGGAGPFDTYVVRDRIVL